jgi:hypothetical protein
VFNIISNQEFVLVGLHRRSKWMLLAHCMAATPVKKSDGGGAWFLPPILTFTERAEASTLHCRSFLGWVQLGISLRFNFSRYVRAMEKKSPHEWEQRLSHFMKAFTLELFRTRNRILKKSRNQFTVPRFQSWRENNPFPQDRGSDPGPITSPPSVAPLPTRREKQISSTWNLSDWSARTPRPSWAYFARSTRLVIQKAHHKPLTANRHARKSQAKRSSRAQSVHRPCACRVHEALELHSLHGNPKV